MADAWIDRGYAFPKNTPLNVHTRPTVATEEPTVVCAANLVEAVGEEQDAIGAVVALQRSSGTATKSVSRRPPEWRRCPLSSYGLSTSRWPDGSVFRTGCTPAVYGSSLTTQTR